MDTRGEDLASELSDVELGAKLRRIYHSPYTDEAAARLEGEGDRPEDGERAPASEIMRAVRHYGHARAECALKSPGFDCSCMEKWSEVELLLTDHLSSTEAGEDKLYVCSSCGWSGPEPEEAQVSDAHGFTLRDTCPVCDAMVYRTTRRPTQRRDEPMTGAQRITRERRRQKEEEGWDESHDDEHQDCEMALAALCYLGGHIERHHTGDEPDPPMEWPWSREWWKPKGPIRDLVRAGALIAAEIDRLLRADRPDPSTEEAEPDWWKCARRVPDETVFMTSHPDRRTDSSEAPRHLRDDEKMRGPAGEIPDWPTDPSTSEGSRKLWHCPDCGWSGRCRDLDRSADNMDPKCPTCGCIELEAPEEWDPGVTFGFDAAPTETDSWLEKRMADLVRSFKWGSIIDCNTMDARVRDEAIRRLRQPTDGSQDDE